MCRQYTHTHTQPSYNNTIFQCVLWLCKHNTRHVGSEVTLRKSTTVLFIFIWLFKKMDTWAQRNRRGRRASPRRGRALARAAGIARRRCGNVRHVGHGAGSGSGGRAADLECGSGRGRRGAVFGRGGRPCWGRGQCGGGGGAGRPCCTEKEVEEAAGVLPPSPPAPPPPPGLFL